MRESSSFPISDGRPTGSYRIEAPIESPAGGFLGPLLFVAPWPTFLNVVQERRKLLGPDSYASGPEAMSPHILASMFRWDDWVFRIPESEGSRSEEHTSELQSLRHLVCRLLLEKKKKKNQKKKYLI